jgi:hypothetical protein
MLLGISSILGSLLFLHAQGPDWGAASVGAVMTLAPLVVLGFLVVAKRTFKTPEIP